MKISFFQASGVGMLLSLYPPPDAKKQETKWVYVPQVSIVSGNKGDLYIQKSQIALFVLDSENDSMQLVTSQGNTFTLNMSNNPNLISSIFSITDCDYR